MPSPLGFRQSCPVLAHRAASPTDSDTPTRASQVAATCIAALVYLLLSCDVTLAQSVDEQLWCTDGGVVRTVVTTGNTIYIGGEFGGVGPSTGGGAPLDPGSGALPPAYPKVLGRIFAVVSDGAGGWFIGGDFTTVGGQPRRGLAQIRSDLKVSDWNPGPDGFNLVYALAVHGSTVYVSGFFDNIGGESRHHIAAIDVASGKATAWHPIIDGDIVVMSILPSDSVVYLGGEFNIVDGQTRNAIVAVDAVNGTVQPWDPNASGFTSNTRVRAMAASGNFVFAGGDFRRIGSVPRNYLAKLSTLSGKAVGWNANTDGTVWAILVSGSIVYVGGDFTHIGGKPREHLAALDVATGAVTAWDPSPNSSVYSLAIDGSTLYVGGTFRSIGGVARNLIAAVDTGSGAVQSFGASANDAVRGIAVSGSRVFVGGWFSSLGIVLRPYLAALDARSGAARDWDPHVNGPVYQLAMGGSSLYVSGGFSEVGGQARKGLAALDPASGRATDWAPDVGEPSAILTVAPHGPDVYVGGAFTSIGGQQRSNLAALDARTGRATSWDPEPDRFVRALEFHGSTVFAAGEFTTIGGQPRNYVAALDAKTGVARDWDAHIHGEFVYSGDYREPSVNAIELRGSTLYMGGWFDHVGDQPRRNAGAVDVTTAEPTPWNPDAGDIVDALAVGGSTVYVGGEFTTMGGEERPYLAAVDAATGATTAWVPRANWLVNALAVEGGTVYVGGRFGAIDEQPIRGIAELTTDTGPRPVDPGLQWNGQGSNTVARQLDNFPNPFRVSTRISFAVSSATRVTLQIFDVAGREVATLMQDQSVEAGSHSLEFTHAGLPAGVYLSKMRAGPDVLIRKMLVLD